ncbi:hypothetical protein ACFQZ4_06960 [Catellatospora coxensis]|uniref:Subtilisin inhibitor-like n=1 Tax=Catellatospora coxensis TaxID=310354 RepID=A0A8J3L2Y0_9ACTN|nr:hypothetical protein [Catellatospora coxensis]GIG10409.1 hypothetical protein Cco03nite_71090 [Catellatospora coxensis]
MAHLSRMLRLAAVAVLAAAAVGVAPSAATAGEEPAPGGIEPKTLVAVCEQLRGAFYEDPKSLYPYGCVLPDGEISCRESTACAFRPVGDLPPLEETCRRVGGLYHVDVRIFVCVTEMYAVEVACDDDLGDCSTSVANEQPMPRPKLVTRPV